MKKILCWKISFNSNLKNLYSNDVDENFNEKF